MINLVRIMREASYTEKEVKEIEALFSSSKPTDLIRRFTADVDHYIELIKTITPAKKSLDVMSTTEKEEFIMTHDPGINMDDAFCMTGDIMLNNVVPIEDLLILMCDTTPNKIQNYGRIKVLPIEQRRKNVNDFLSGKSETALVGYYKLEFPHIPGDFDCSAYADIYITEAYGGIVIGFAEKMGILTDNPAIEASWMNDPEWHAWAQSKILHDLEQCLGIWYVLQYTLLVPLIREYISTTKICDPRHKPTNKKKFTEYRINFTKIKRNIAINPHKDSAEAKGHTIKKPIWYVTGHWREYKSGKRVFIQGYWKGPERELGEIDIPRIREIPKEMMNFSEEEKSHIYNMGDFYQELLNKANTYYAGNEK